MENNKKNILIGTGVVIGGYILYQIINTQIKKNKPSVVIGDSGNTGGGGVTKGLNYYNLSDDLYTAISGYYSDDTKVLLYMSKLNTDDDMDSLYKAYGTKTIDTGALNFFQKNFTGDLYQTIRNRLSSTNLNQLNTILSNKGISISI